MAYAFNRRGGDLTLYLQRLAGKGALPHSVKAKTMTIPKSGGIALTAFAGGVALYAAIPDGATRVVTNKAANDTAAAPSRCADLVAYGADPTGQRDSIAAFRAAAAAGDRDAVCVHIPTGTFRFASAPAVSAGAAADAAIAITGEGAGLSRLLFDAGTNGPAIRLTGPRQSFAIRDLSILAGGANEDTTGLSVDQSGAPASNPAQSEIRGVIVRGRDGFGAADRFATGIALHRVSNVTFTTVTIAGSPDGAPYATQGTCLLIDGTEAAISVQINIVSSQINHCERGLVYGPYLQGVQITASNFTGNGTAIHQPAGNKGNDQLAITTSQFNSGLHDLLLEAPIDGVTIGSNHFYLAEGGGAAIATRGVQFAVHGNSFHQFGKARATAIAVGPFLLDAGAITGNSFNNFATAIRLDSGSSRVTVQGNAFSDIAGDRVRDRGTDNVVAGGQGNQ